MRYRLMASFQGGSYQAGVGPSDEEVTLFAACPPPEELGFRSSSGHWCKRVSVEEIDALWESRPIGRYRGERCMVLDDLGDRVHIAYLGRDLYLARRLGFWEVDRGVFEVVVPRQEIQELREERGEYELALLDDGSPPGSWDAGPRETWASNPREYGDAPDTGPLRAVGPPRELVDTGPPWAPGARGPREPGGWNGGGWDLRDEQAQDPRDTGTWAAVRDVDPRDLPEPDGPFPRGRGGWRARDTGGWEAPDTGAWDAREVAERAAREASHAPGTSPGRRNTGSWNAADVAEAAARNSGGWNAADAQAAGPGTGGWNAADAQAAGPGTGGWSAPEIADAAARDLRNARDLHDARDTRDAADGWDMREVAPSGRREVERWEPADRWDPPADRWDPQDTVAWNPQSSGEWDAPAVPWGERPARPMHARSAEVDPRETAGREPNEVLRPGSHQRTPDAAAGWHGSPTPQDSGRWSTPVSANGYNAPPRLAIGSGRPPSDLGISGPASGPQPFSHRKNGYDDPPLARETAAMNGSYGAAVSTPEAASPAGAGGVPGAPGASGAPGVAGHAGRHGGRRSGRRTRVTAQAVFSQLLDQASIPQSSYAVDAEVDGAMCLVHARGGYEVFSSADRTRHELRFFEDEEAAYFYLFGILAAEAIRSGRLGPQTAPPGHRSRSAQPGYPSSGR